MLMKYIMQNVNAFTGEILREMHYGDLFKLWHVLSIMKMLRKIGIKINLQLF